MIDLIVNAKIQDVIEELCNNLKSFTSLDISNAIKKLGHQIRHRNIAQEVREIMVQYYLNDVGAYERTLIDVTLSNGDTKQAFLYHHSFVDPDTYQNRSAIALPVVSTDATDDNDSDPQTVVPRAISPNPVFLNDSRQIPQKGDCRLEIPASWVRELDWQDGESVYICDTSNSKLEVKEASSVDATDNVLGTVRISGGRLRISKSAFDKTSFSHSPYAVMNVTLSSDRVLIEE